MAWLHIQITSFFDQLPASLDDFEHCVSISFLGKSLVAPLSWQDLSGASPEGLLQQGVLQYLENFGGGQGQGRGSCLLQQCSHAVPTQTTVAA